VKQNEGTGDQNKKAKSFNEETTYHNSFPAQENQNFKKLLANNLHKLSKEKIISEAFKFHANGNTLEAAKYYKYFIDKGFVDERVFSNYGKILMDLGVLQEAKLFLEKAIHIKPTYSKAYNTLGTLLQKLGCLPEAEIAIRKAITFEPNFAGAYFNLGTLLRELGKSVEAELEERKGIDISFIENMNYQYKSNCLKYIGLSKSDLRQDLFALSELNFKKAGYFVEFGACDGLVGSNSYLLEKVFQWNGILAEPSSFWHPKLHRNRSVNIETRCVWKSSNDELIFKEIDKYHQLSTIDSFSDSDKGSKYRKCGRNYKVKTISLLDLLEKYRAPREIDYLSIDTEGSEYEILKNFDFNKYRIKVITCEHNFTSLRDKIYELLSSKGYKRKFTKISRVDDWYVLNR
tara:strand:+ start:101 stop:1309 length:1209 start_codon:yes stop_codon:yes gene_type:complete